MGGRVFRNYCKGHRIQGREVGLVGVGGGQQEARMQTTVIEQQ